jgi:hypothetical protein
MDHAEIQEMRIGFNIRKRLVGVGVSLLLSSASYSLFFSVLDDSHLGGGSSMCCGAVQLLRQDPRGCYQDHPR